MQKNKRKIHIKLKVSNDRNDDILITNQTWMPENKTYLKQTITTIRLVLA